MIFADDTQLYHHFFPAHFHLALARITRDAQAVANWARANGLILNSSKTKVIIIGSVLYTRELDLETLPRVIIDGHPFSYATEARSLGVTFTNSLDWQVYARLVTRKVFGTLFNLRFFRHAISRDIRKHLVESFAFPIFDYASPVYNHLDDARVKKIETTMNACVRFVVGNIPLQAFNIVANRHPEYLTERFNCRVLVDLDLRRSDRHPPQPFEPFPRRPEAYKHSFALRAMDLLNHPLHKFFPLRHHVVQVNTTRRCFSAKHSRLDRARSE